MATKAARGTTAVRKPALPARHRRDTLDLGILPGLVGYRLRRAQLALYQDFLAACAPFALRQAQFAVLEILDRNPGAAPSAVSSALGIKRTNFVPLFDELARRGLGERRTDPGDRRARGLFLTEVGAALVAQARMAILTQEARLAGRLGRDDAELLRALLARAEAAASAT
jgi:DNA-binding MarR family transcriptional regulator